MVIFANCPKAAKAAKSLTVAVLGKSWRPLDRRRGAKRRHHPEQAIQRAVVEHLQRRGVPGLVFLHRANGGFRMAAEAAIFQGLGVRAGASDLLLWHAGQSFALELKAPGLPAAK
jgi:hypothetical protein